MANGINITKETFQELDTDAKLNAVFDVLVSIHAKCTCRAEKCDSRFEKIEDRKKLDTGVSGFFGLIGGGAAWLLQKIFGG